MDSPFNERVTPARDERRSSRRRSHSSSFDQHDVLLEIGRYSAVYVTPRRVLRQTGLAAIVLCIGFAVPTWADTIEFTDGRKVECEIIERTSKSVKINLTVGGREYSREFPLDRIRAVIVDGKRDVIGEKDDGAVNEPATGVSRTREEVQSLIDKLGSTPPDWWDSAEVNYPRSLDLTWSYPPRGVWENQRYVGQYIWDIINPNPSKWREGIRLMHYLLEVNGDRPEVRQRVMVEIGRMYHDLLRDYSRAAFWWQKAKVDKSQDGSLSAVHLAECYAKLGCKEMALELLDNIPPMFATIKVWADMGELDRALGLADANAEGAYADIACIYAGDACRVAGQYEKALEYYEKLLAMPATGQGWKRVQRNQMRARENAQAIKLFELLDLTRVPDGVYHASSMGFKGEVYVEISVKSQRIESLRVTQHEEKQFYSALTDTPQKIIARQSVKGIDATSGATVTSDAIVNAAAKALAKVMQQKTAE